MQRVFSQIRTFFILFLVLSLLCYSSNKYWHRKRKNNTWHCGIYFNLFLCYDSLRLSQYVWVFHHQAAWMMVVSLPVCKLQPDTRSEGIIVHTLFLYLCICVFFVFVYLCICVIVCLCILICVFVYSCMFFIYCHHHHHHEPILKVDIRGHWLWQLTVELLQLKQRARIIYYFCNIQIYCLEKG